MVADTPEKEFKPKDRPLDLHRTTHSDKAEAMVGDVLNQLQKYEKYFTLRKRKRKQKDQANFEATVEAVVCDLAHRYITEPDGWVTVPLSKQKLGRGGRYSSPLMNKTLPDILERLASLEMAFVEIKKGYQNHFGRGDERQLLFPSNVNYYFPLTTIIFPVSSC